jgi:hypothetical protein
VCGGAPPGVRVAVRHPSSTLRHPPTSRSDDERGWRWLVVGGRHCKWWLLLVVLVGLKFKSTSYMSDEDMEVIGSASDSK